MEISTLLKMDSQMEGLTIPVDKAREAIDELAIQLQAKDPGLSFEQAYVKAMDMAPRLAACAVGNAR